MNSFLMFTECVPRQGVHLDRFGGNRWLKPINPVVLRTVTKEWSNSRIGEESRVLVSRLGPLAR